MGIKIVMYDEKKQAQQIISNIFSINHDGVIINIEEENEALAIQIEIEYLAELRASEHKTFVYKLLEYSNLKFIDICNENKTYTNIEEIKQMELTILESGIRDEKIIIGVCSHKSAYGELEFMTNGVMIFDQDNVKMEYTELQEIAKKYWENWSKK